MNSDIKDIIIAMINNDKFTGSCIKTAKDIVEVYRILSSINEHDGYEGYSDGNEDEVEEEVMQIQYLRT